MEQPTKIAFLGAALDCDERQEALDEKLDSLGLGGDPYPRVMELIRAEVDPARWTEAGRLEVPAWLLPGPPPEAADQLSVESMVRFIDQGGCWDAATEVGRLADGAWPAAPCLIAVDHSLAGGVMAALGARLGPENLSVLVADSHTDAIPMAALAGAIAYDQATNPASVYDPDDPYLRDRPESYNASSFLRHLLDQGLILPQNLYLLGLGDWPPKQAFRSKDPRLAAYTQAYSRLKQAGVGLVTKADLAAGSQKLKALLRRIQTPYLYVSLDLDLGAGAALDGVRFQDRIGLGERQLYALAALVRGVLGMGAALAGLDVCEFNTRRAGADRTYRIAANLIEIIAFGQPPRP
ncbi:MAG: arginase family protein [Thermodesulfobacteriota bacterium]